MYIVCDHFISSSSLKTLYLYVYLESGRIKFLWLGIKIRTMVDASEERKNFPSFGDDISLELHVLHRLPECERQYASASQRFLYHLYVRLYIDNVILYVHVVVYMCTLK